MGMTQAGQETPMPEDGGEEIAKKDLLRKAGISYGQFYRWKRMGLIPESWFRRRSTFTGQETFLPRKKVMERIQRIQQLKDEHPLERVAQLLSPDVVRRGYASDDVERMDWITPRCRELLLPLSADGSVGFLEVLCLTVMERLLATGQLSDEQVRQGGAAILNRFDALVDAVGERHLSVIASGGATVVLLHTDRCVCDEDCTVLAEISLDHVIEEIKVALMRITE